MDFGHNNGSQQAQRQHQRFSWQPVPEHEAPPYVAVQQQPAPQPAQHQESAQPYGSPDVNNQNRHFSYAQTPIEHEAFFYVASPTDPPMPLLPHHPQPSIQHMQSPYMPTDPHTTVPPQSQTAYIPPSSRSQDEKPPYSQTASHNSAPASITTPASPSPPTQVHHQYHPTQTPTVAIPQNNHVRKPSGLSPINTNVSQHRMPPIPPTPPSGQISPLPQKAPITPISPDGARTRPTNKENRQSYANEPYSPHGLASNQTSNFHAVFSPDASHGPNGLDFSLHQPGQITHPNMDSQQTTDWTHSLCACSPDMATCLTGLFCPCILYGRTAYRLSQKSAKKDPTDMLGHRTTSGHCLMMSLACGVWSLFPMLQRTRIRHVYKLSGSCAGDVLTGCCCCCCVAVQNEREVRSREEASRRWAGPASAHVYSRAPGMVYKAQS